jgi:hypothetical protein
MIENKDQIDEHVFYTRLADKLMHALYIVKANFDGYISKDLALNTIMKEVELPSIYGVLLNSLALSIMKTEDFPINQIIRRGKVYRKDLLNDSLDLIDINKLEFKNKTQMNMENTIERKNFYLSKSLLGKNKVVKFNQNGKSYTYNHDDVFDKCRDELLTNPKRANSFPKHGTYTSYKVPAFVIDKASDLIKAA